MAFYYYYNSGANILTPNEQMMPYYSSVASIPQNNFDAFTGPFYVWNLSQNNG